MILSENSESFMVDRNPELKYFGTETIRGVKTDFGKDESGSVKIKKLYYPKKDFSKERVSEIMEKKLKNCPLCTAGIQTKTLYTSSNKEKDRNTSKNDKRLINMDRELIYVAGSQFVGRGIQEVENMVPMLNTQVVPKVSYKRILNIVGGLGLLLGTQTKYVPENMKLPVAVVGSKLLADEVVDAGKEFMATGYAPAQATVSFVPATSGYRTGLVQVT